MLWLILALVVCVTLASVVIGLVAVPARREGREVLTDRGERMISSVTACTKEIIKQANGAVVKRHQADVISTEQASETKIPFAAANETTSAPITSDAEKAVS